MIPFSQYIYGELAAEVVAEGLNLCSDFKLKRQLEKQNVTVKQALGDFCQQFSYEDLKSVNWRKSEKPQKNTPHRRTERYSKKRYQKKSEPKQQAKLAKKRPKKLRGQPTCYKCGKSGYYNNNYKAEAKINSLNLDKGPKRQLMQVC